MPLKHRLSFLLGPALGAALILFAFARAFGPGLLLLCVFTGASLAFVAPALQYIIQNSEKYRDQTLKPMVIAVGVAVVPLAFVALLGGFNFW